MSRYLDIVFDYYPTVGRSWTLENGLITLLYLSADAGHSGLCKILLLALSEIRKIREADPS